METTDKGTLKIRMDNECRKFVVFNPINRTVWMRKCELIELFFIPRNSSFVVDRLYERKTDSPSLGYIQHSL